VRVSNQMLSQMLTNNILDNQTAVYSKEQQVASGKRIQRASDDPTAWAQATRLHGQQERLDQYARNSSMLTSQIASADHSLVSISSILQNASEIAVQGSDATLNAEDRKVLAEQADQLLEQLLTQANGKFNGHYQFGGVRTDSPPFTVTRNAERQISAVSYVGATSASMVEIAEGDSVPSQFVGGDPDNGILISSSSNVFSGLIEMRDRLLAGENLAETSVQESVDVALEKVVVSRAAIGAYQEHLVFVDEIRENQESVLREGISAVEDIDIAQAVSELSEKQMAYQAALAMATQTIKLSLLNYL